MDNNIVTISAREYEQLIWDSEKIRILTQMVLDKTDIGAYVFKAILGIRKEK